PYRHGALLCVHQVEPAPPRLSSIPEELPPGARSSGPPFRVRLRQLVRSRQAVASVICLRQLPSLHPQISWILQESRKVSHFPLHPLLGMVRGFHFLLRPGSAILHLAVLLWMLRAVDFVAVFVVLAVFAAGSASDPACSVCPVYSVRSSAAARGKGRAVLVFYSSVLRSSASRNRNCPSLPCFAGRA